MKKASEYLQHGAGCRALAAAATNPQHIVMLLKMAEAWEGLARDREARFAREQLDASKQNPK